MIHFKSKGAVTATKTVMTAKERLTEERLRWEKQAHLQTSDELRGGQGLCILEGHEQIKRKMDKGNRS